MPDTPQSDPFRRLSWLDRRRWSRRARRVVREFESETLADLRSLARSGVHLDWMSLWSTSAGDVTPGATAALGPGLAGPVEFSAGGRRVVAAAVWAPAWEALVGAWRGAGLTLAGAGRYHRSWVLSFRFAVTSGPQAGAGRNFVLLASRVRFLDQWGGQTREGGSLGLPVLPVALG